LFLVLNLSCPSPPFFILLNFHCNSFLCTLKKQKQKNKNKKSHVLYQTPNGKIAGVQKIFKRSTFSFQAFTGHPFLVGFGLGIEKKKCKKFFYSLFNGSI
jgi:hypothetical protein